MGTFNEERLLNELDLTEGEQDLIAASETGDTPQANKTRIYSSIYTVKHMEQSVAKLIASNEVLSKSNDRYARAMNLLTGGLLVVAMIQLIVLFVN